MNGTTVVSSYPKTLPSLGLEPGNVHYDNALGLDDSGDVVGQSYVVGIAGSSAIQADYIPFGASTATDIGTFNPDIMPPPTTAGASWASAINNSQQVVGTSDITVNGSGYNHAYLWKPGSTLFDIGAKIGNTTDSYAAAINNSSAMPPATTVVGTYGVGLFNGDGEGFVYDTLAQTFMTLADYSAGNVQPTGVNDAKFIAGNGASGSIGHALEYLSPTSYPTDLDPFAGTGSYLSSNATAINNHQDVTGYAGPKATIWYGDTNGNTITPYPHYMSVTYVDLNASNVIDPNYTLTEAYTNNDYGQIAGVETDLTQGGGNTQALLLTPQFSGDLSAAAVKSSGSVTLTVTVPANLPAGSYIFKFGPSTAIFSPTSVTLTPGGSSTVTITAPNATQTLNITITNTTLGTLSLPLLVMGLPTMTSVNPSHAAIGATVTITGAGLQYTNTLGFPGQHASNYTVSNDGTMITAVVPAGATSGYLAVLTPGGRGNSKFIFNIP